MKTVFVTGGIGAGKSAVAAYLASRGVPVYEADARTKRLYGRSPELVAAMEAALGTPLRGNGGRLDRQKLASVIFSDPDALEAVERLVHPRVRDDFLAWKETVSRAVWCGYGPVPFAVMESALVLSKPLFRGLADKIVWVEAPEELRVARACARDGVSEAAVRSRMARQQAGSSRADAVILNDSTLEVLRRRVDETFARLIK